MAFAQGIIRVIGDDGAPATEFESRSIAISDLGAFFRVLGPDDARLKWQERHGFGTFGSDGLGSYLYDAFPVLSQIGWMNIDEVAVGGTDLISLAQESERASSVAEGLTERDIFRRLARLAREVSVRHLKLEFGHA